MIGLKKPRLSSLKIALKSRRWFCLLGLIAPLVSASINLANGPAQRSLKVSLHRTLAPAGGTGIHPKTLSKPQTNEKDEPKRAQTTEEKQAAMDEALRQALQRFDGLLLREKELLQEQGSASASGGGGGRGSGQNGRGSGAAGEAGRQKAGDGNKGASSSPTSAETAGSDDPAGGTIDGYPGGPQRDRRNPSGKAGSRGDQVPDDIPSSSAGDDIVARQIREAAMQEEDPQLRERLWDEYRKYKGLKPRNGSGREGGEPQKE